MMTSPYTKVVFPPGRPKDQAAGQPQAGSAKRNAALPHKNGTRRQAQSAQESIQSTLLPRKGVGGSLCRHLEFADQRAQIVQDRGAATDAGIGGFHGLHATLSGKTKQDTQAVGAAST